MQRNSVSCAPHANQPSPHANLVSPLRMSIDSRFCNLLTRAADRHGRSSQIEVSPVPGGRSLSISMVTSNPWSPIETIREIPAPTEKRLSSAWKTRLQGLCIGFIVTAISIGITLGILLTRTSRCSTTLVSETVSSCSSLQWNLECVIVAGNGTYGSTATQLSAPWGVYIGANNTRYVIDSNNHRVQQWLHEASFGTKVAGITGVPGSNNSLLYSPRVLSGDDQQNLYIGDSYGIIIWPIGASVGRRVLNATGWSFILGIAVDQNKNIYASTSANCAVIMWSPTTNATTIVANTNGCGSSSFQLDSPTGIVVDSSTRTIFIANTDSYTIVAWQVGAATGTIIAGRNSTTGTTTSLLSGPLDIKQDQYGNIYVADSYNARVLLFCQNPLSTSATIIAGYQFSLPTTIAFDSDMNLYVADFSNSQILKFNRIIQ